jgi:hypothetical protein
MEKKSSSISLGVTRRPNPTVQTAIDIANFNLGVLGEPPNAQQPDDDFAPQALRSPVLNLMVTRHIFVLRQVEHILVGNTIRFPR